MAKAHVRDAASQNQSETRTHEDFTAAFPLGSFPMSGRLTDRLWGQILDVNPRTIRDWVVKFNVPHKRLGDVVVIDASDFWTAVPFIVPRDAPKSNRGGARHKKGT